MVEAVIRETMRLDTLTQNNVPHRAQRDTKVGGYDLPEVFRLNCSHFNTTICFTICLRDPM